MQSEQLPKLRLVIIFCSIFFLPSVTFPQIKIVAVGDIMMGSLTPRNSVPQDSGKKIIPVIKKLVNKGHVVFGNLEGPFIRSDMKVIKDCGMSEIRTCYAFGMPDYLAPGLKKMGFNMIALNNNHMDDYGWRGYEHTKRTLAGNNIPYCCQDSVRRLTINGRKCAFIAYKSNGRKFDINNIPAARQLIRELKKQGNIVIVSFHGGAEGKDAYRVEDKDEVFLNENRGNVYRFAHSLIDEGADLILGHGPHVIRPVELYRNRLIVYSMGNFLTHGNISIKGRLGVSMVLEIVLGENGKFIQGNITPVRLKGRGIPHYDPHRTAVKNLQNSMKDFIAGKTLLIKDSGEFFPAQ
ncbi:MAG: CapA family protein [Bacteroidota bacterium]